MTVSEKVALTVYDFKFDFEPEKDYRKGINAAKTPQALVNHVARYRLIADEAWYAAHRLLAGDYGAPAEAWSEWRLGLTAEGKGEFAGVEWAEKFAVILMPNPMFHVSLVAGQFMVPWSVAFKRLVDLKVLVRSTGNYFRVAKQ